MKKNEHIVKVKKQILNALNNGTMINIKIRRSHKPNSYEMQIGDTQNMDLVDSKGSIGLTNFYIEAVLKEIESEMRGLK